MPALLIPIHNLDSVGKDFVFALDEAWLRAVFADTGVSGDASAPGEVAVHAQRNGSEVLVHGRAHARLITECGRCLSPVPVDVACDLAALYTPGQPSRQDEDEEDLDIDPDEPDREFYTGEQVAIDDLVRDYLLLELPMQPRCEPECALPGERLPDAKSAQELGEEIDPRLQPLLKLANGERDKE